MAEFVMVDGVAYPRHPSYQVGRTSEAVRLSSMLQSVEFARKRCTTRERPLYVSLCRIEQIIRRSIRAAAGTPMSPGETMPWETGADRPAGFPGAPPLGNGASTVARGFSAKR